MSADYYDIWPTMTSDPRWPYAEFTVFRKEEYGGPLTFSDFTALETSYANKVTRSL